MSEYDQEIYKIYPVYKNAQQEIFHYSNLTQLNPLEERLSKIPLIGRLLQVGGVMGPPNILYSFREAYTEIQRSTINSLINLIRKRPGLYPLKNIEVCHPKIGNEELGFKYSFDFQIESDSFNAEYWSYLRWGIWVKLSQDQNSHIEITDDGTPHLSLLHLPVGFQIPVTQDLAGWGDKYDQCYCIWQPTVNPESKCITIDFDKFDGWTSTLEDASVYTKTRTVQL